MVCVGVDVDVDVNERDEKIKMLEHTVPRLRRARQG
jgi:hypothetical protein